MAVPYKKLEKPEEYPDHPNVFKWLRLSLSRLSHHSKVSDCLRQSAEARVAEKKVRTSGWSAIKKASRFRSRGPLRA